MGGLENKIVTSNNDDKLINPVILGMLKRQGNKMPQMQAQVMIEKKFQNN